MVYNTAIFDLDDTLVYAPQEFEHSWTKKCLQEFTGKPFTNEQIGNYLKKPIADREKFLRQIGFTNRQQYLDMWLTSDAIAKYVEAMGVFTDATVLKDLKRQGIQLGLVTAGHIGRVSKQVRKLELVFDEQVFDAVVNIHGTSYPSKPEPIALHDCMLQLNANPENSVYVGNSLEKDVEMARRAGVSPVLIDRNAQTNFNSNPIVVNDLRKVMELIR